MQKLSNEQKIQAANGNEQKLFVLQTLLVRLFVGVVTWSRRSTDREERKRSSKSAGVS
jgi:hypothetical protein